MPLALPRSRAGACLSLSFLLPEEVLLVRVLQLLLVPSIRVESESGLESRQVHARPPRTQSEPGRNPQYATSMSTQSEALASQ